MTKVLVLYYSAYGHIETMAEAVAEGAREAGAPSTSSACPNWCRRGRQGVVLQARPGGPDRQDRRPRQLRRHHRRHRHALRPDGVADGEFLDQAGGLWAKGALHGKVGGAFTSTATQHGGQETTLFSIITNLLHFGMTIVGLNYGFAGQMKLDEVTGGSPYGATTITGGDGSRSQPRTNSPAPAIKAARSRRPRKNCTADAIPAAFLRRCRPIAPPGEEPDGIGAVRPRTPAPGDCHMTNKPNPKDTTKKTADPHPGRWRRHRRTKPRPARKSCRSHQGR